MYSQPDKYIEAGSFQIPSSRIDTRKMSFFLRTVRDWNLLAPDIVEMDTPEAFKARIVSL